MKAQILAIDGKKKGEMTLPKFFSEKIRVDLIQKIFESKKVKQPYAPSPIAGNQASASGVLKHHRKVWKSQYGRGMSRVPRKQMSRRGSQFNWVGATVPNTRGGRRAHPPKVASMLTVLKVNKKELKLAIIGALSATVNEKYVAKRYERLNGKKLHNLPLVVESKFVELKTKELLQNLKTILGEDLYEVAIQKKTIRSGKGKLRGRKYKNNLGLLFVTGKDEKLKTTAFDVKKADKVGINDLANGGVGRLTVYTEKAIKDLEAKYK